MAHRGTGQLGLLFFDISVPFSHTWGGDQDTALDPIAVFPLLEAELERPHELAGAAPEREQHRRVAPQARRQRRRPARAAPGGLAAHQPAEGPDQPPHRQGGQPAAVGRRPVLLGRGACRAGLSVGFHAARAVRHRPVPRPRRLGAAVAARLRAAGQRRRDQGGRRPAQGEPSGQARDPLRVGDHRQPLQELRAAVLPLLRARLRGAQRVRLQPLPHRQRRDEVRALAAPQEAAHAGSTSGSR